MKNVRLLIAMSIILLGFLFFLNFIHLDIAPSKNHALMIHDENEIHKVQNLDSAKEEAIYWREVVSQNFVEQSNTSTRQLAIVFATIVLQIVLLNKVKRNN